MHKYKILIVFILLGTLSFASGYDSDRDTVSFSVRAVRLTEPVKIDGLLSEAVWQSCPAATNFRQRDPLEGMPATESTSVRIAYDDDAIYVAAKMYDSAPDSIQARLGRRDAGVNSDAFVFFIDPFYDKMTGYYFALSAAGTLADGVLFNDDWDDNSWDGIWEGKASIDKEGWSVEMRIPYSQLKFLKADKYVWGVNAKRIISRKNESDYLTFTPKKGSGFVSRFVPLEGIERISPPGQVEILPYITAKAEYLRHDAADPFNDGSVYTPAIGADMKIGIGSNLTLNATINPDFGQVEVDPAVVNLSDAETYFQEKRPFFIEGSSVFNFGIGGANNYWGFNWGGPEMFYSRRIGRYPQGSLPDNNYADVPDGARILGAAKLTGKIWKNWNLGSVNAVTQREFADYEYTDNNIKKRGEAEVEPLTHYGLLRMQRDFNGGRQGFGFMTTYTNRFFKDSRLKDNINSGAYVLGTDGWTFLDKDKEWVLTGWAAGSVITGNRQRMIDVQTNSVHYFQRPDLSHVGVDSSAASLTGMAARFYINKQKGNTFVNTAFGFISPGFDVNDLGFVWRTDVINMHLGAGYKWTDPGKVFRYAELGGAYFRGYDFGYNKTGEGIFHFGYVEFLNYYGINWNAGYNPETINARQTRGGPLSMNHRSWNGNISLNSDSRRAWVYSLGMSGSWYAEGEYYSYWTSFEWRPKANLTISLQPSVDLDDTGQQWVDAFDDQYATATYGRRYVFARMKQTTFSAGIRMNWTFTPALSLQLYVQPLITTGKYSDFKELRRSRTHDYRIFGTDESTVSYNQNDNRYTVDPDGQSGPASAFEFDNPDFNYRSIRGNAVLRWEYLPGSTLYLVWTQTRDDDRYEGDFNFGRSMGRLFNRSADNIFMLKFTYWFHL